MIFLNYYIDFDNTLYKTKALTEKMLNTIARICLREKGLEIDKIIEEAKKMFNRENIYNIFELCKFFGNKYKIKEEIIKKEIINIILNGKEDVYDDSIEFLEFLKKGENKLHLLTYTAKGDIEYQSLKIMGSGLANFFDTLIITSEPKYELDLNYKNGIFIDDNPKDLIGLYKKNPIDLIRIRRADNKYSLQDIDIEIKEYNNLKEIQN